MSSPVEIKIAYIGGGSRDWAHKLMADLSLCPRLTGQLDLYDTDLAAAEHNARVADAIFTRPDALGRFRTRAVRRPGDALREADFVVLSIEPGPTRMRYADLEIPRKYGIIQTVGDTTGPGGLLRALRTVPIKVDYAHQIMRHCPNAWVINYTNPMTLSVAALYAAEPRIKAFGCCHEVFGTQAEIAALVGEWFGTAVPPRQEIRLDISGVNHFTMAAAASWRGRDLMPRLRELAADSRLFRDRTRSALRRVKQRQWFGSDNLVKFDLLRNFGVLGAAGDRHLMEFVPWYLTSEENVHRWGVVLTPYSYREQRAASPRPDVEGFRRRGILASGEEGVAQMLALTGVKPLRTNVNLPNRGQMPGAPAGAIVETMAAFSRDCVKPLDARPLPAPALELQRRVIHVQSMVLEAAIRKDRDLAFAALLSDPLMRLPVDDARCMFAEMLEYTRPVLPAW